MESPKTRTYTAKHKRYYEKNKEQLAAKMKEYREKHREKALAYAKAYYAANKGKFKELARKWREANLRVERAANKAWREANRDLRAAQEAKRRSAKLHATPAWANDRLIVEAYDLAQRSTKATGYPWHVDHIVPLQHPLVCGLHVENNLRVIPARINQSKNNHFWPDMPKAD